MNLKNYFLGAGLIMAGPVMAASLLPNVNSFPVHTPVPADTPLTADRPERAPLNPEKDLGTKIFGYTVNDFEGISHYVNFYNKSTYRINKIKDILIDGVSYDEYPRSIHNNAGVWAGDGYYTYRLFYYTYTTRLVDWVKVDPATGDSHQLYQWASATTGDPSWWSIPQALAWNPNIPEDIYVLARNTDGSITSVVHKVDRNNGQFKSKEKVLSKYYFAMAFDYDNQIYALTWDSNDKGEVTGTILDVIDPYENYSIVSSTPILVEGKPWEIYYDNSLTFDYTTGELWWNAVRPMIQGGQVVDIDSRLVKIDPLTMATESFGTLGVNEEIGGLYIDYVTAENRKAPAIVTDADFAIDNAGDLKVTLEWTNPSTQWNRRKLSNLSAVEIYRDSYPGTPAGTVTATGKEGLKMNWTDTGATNGVHTYYIVPVNASGKGVPCKLDAFVGKDVPGPVQNVIATTPDGRMMHIEWSKPVRGDNDGWFDDSDLSYTLVRMPDGTTVGTTKETSFDDNTIGDADRYYYLIYASNAQGKGSAGESTPVLAGHGIKPYFSTDFRSKEDADRFSVIDRNGDGKTFEFGDNNHLVRKSFVHLLSDYDNDDVLVTPTLKVEKGKTYKVTFDIFFNSLNLPGTRTLATPFRLLGGTEPTAEAMTDVLFDDPDKTVIIPMQTEKYSAYFTAPVDGDYYVGLETLISREDLSWLYIEGMEIDNAPSDDLEAVSVDTHLNLSTTGANEFRVKIYNNGDKEQTGYAVKLAVLDRNGQPSVFHTSTNVPAVKSHETVVAKLYAKMPTPGQYSLVAIADLEGDGNDRNDMSEPVVVLCDEIDPLNVTITDETCEDRITNVPFNHYSSCTASQTIYTPEMSGLDVLEFEGTPRIMRIAWEGTSLSDIPTFTDTRLTVYLSQTDEVGFAPNSGMIRVSGEPLFDDYVSLGAGRNYVVADFEEGFVFDPTRPLLVTVLKEDNVHGDWLFDWRVFDADWEAPYFHSIGTTGSSPIDVTAPSGRMVCFAPAPVVHLAVTGLVNGIDEVVISGNHIAYFNRTDSTVHTPDFAIASVEVYNLNGQLVDRVAGDGSASVRVNADNGMAIIKVNGVDGTSFSFKTII